MTGRSLFCSALVLSTCLLLSGQAGEAPENPLAPSLNNDDLDPKTFRQWVEGTESDLGEKFGPGALVWTRQGKPGAGELRYNGMRFGDGRQPGLRHLRVGLTAPKVVGTVLLAGNGRV